MIPGYIGNGAYCYANCIAMLLNSIGEDISSSTAEVLSGVGIGAFWDEKREIGLFSNYWTEPPKGIDNAFRLLGFKVKKHIQQSRCNPPFEQLKRDVKRTPAIIGPIDLQYLKTGGKSKEPGADHFVLVYKITESEVFIHDPHEYPCVALSHSHFLQMWKAENITYKKGEYNYWTNPNRNRKPSNKQLYQSALNLFAEVYQRTDGPVGVQNHADAFRAVGSFINRNRGPKHLSGHLLSFSLPLGSRRALDYAAFFEPYDKTLAKLKEEQAGLFGRTVVMGKQDNWRGIAETLAEIADVEEKFKDEILHSN